ncbi:hypothetical protein Ancab_005425 [Ancistrocladus abbreviatus]
MAVISETEFLEVAGGLANSEQPFLWVIRPGLVRDMDGLHPLQGRLLDMITKKGHIIDWAPQQEVLAHPAIGGFWTHSGWNSTLESICEGVPMICLPIFADQAINARFASEVWKVGILLENSTGLERAEVEKAVRSLMEEKEGADIRERTAYLKNKAILCLKEEILHSKGFSISIIHTRFNTPLDLTAEHSNFTFHPIKDGLTESEVSMMEEDVLGFINTVNNKCEKALWDCLSKMMVSDDRPDQEAIGCLIADSFWFAAHPAAESLNLPRLTLRTANASATLFIASLPLLKEKGYLPIKGW